MAVQTALYHRTDEASPVEDDLSPFFEISSDLQVLADFSGRLLRVNPAFERATGHKEAEIRGRPVLRLVHPDHRLQAEAALGRAARGEETAPLALLCRQADGAYRWIEWIGRAAAGRLYLAGRDITAGRERELRLVKSDYMLRKAQRIAKLGGWRSDLRRRRATWSDQTYSIFGIERGSFVPSLRNVLDRVLPEDRPAVEKWLAAVRVRDGVADIEFRIRRTDGEIRHVWADAQRELDADGDVVSLFGVCQDVTERRRAEEELARARDMLLQVSRGIPGAVYQYRLEADGRHGFTFMSEGVRDLYGIPPDVALSDIASIFAATRTEDLPRVYASIAESARTLTPWACEYRVTTADGDRWIRGHSIPTRQGDATVWNGVLIDVTEYKRIAAELDAARRMLVDVTAGVPGAVYRFARGPDGKIRFPFISEGVAPIFGVTAEEVMRDSDALTSRIVPEDVAAIEESSAAAKASCQPWTAEFRIRGPAGLRWIRGSSLPRMTPDGDLVWNGFLCDITEQKQREAQLFAAKIEAEQASRAKSAFLANMSHELRTPLNAVIGFSDMIRFETFGPIGHPNYRGYIQDIHDSGRHLLSLIESILDLAKIEAGTVEVAPERIEAAELLSETVRFFVPESKRAGVHLSVDAGTGRCPVVADPRHLRQMLINLVGNALKFTPAGGAIRLGAGRVDGRIEISVRDTGIGIPADRLNRVTERFFQADSVLSRRRGGAGIGLHIAQQLAERNGAELRIRSTPGEGTEVTISFPIPVEPA